MSPPRLPPDRAPTARRDRLRPVPHSLYRPASPLGREMGHSWAACWFRLAFIWDACISVWFTVGSSVMCCLIECFGVGSAAAGATAPAPPATARGEGCGPFILPRRRQPLPARRPRGGWPSPGAATGASSCPDSSRTRRLHPWTSLASDARTPAPYRRHNEKPRSRCSGVWGGAWRDARTGGSTLSGAATWAPARRRPQIPAERLARRSPAPTGAGAGLRGGRYRVARPDAVANQQEMPVPAQLSGVLPVMDPLAAVSVLPASSEYTPPPPAALLPVIRA